MPSGSNALTRLRCPGCKAFAHAGPCKPGSQPKPVPDPATVERDLALQQSWLDPPVRVVAPAETDAANVPPLTPGEISALRNWLRSALCYSPRDLISIPAASRLSGIDQETIYHWVKRGILPVYGRRRLYRVSWTHLLPLCRPDAIPDDMPK